MSRAAGTGRRAMARLRQAARVVVLAALSAGPVAAAPETFLLETARSRVGFTYYMQGSPARGTMPIAAASLAIDLDDLPASSVDVSVDVSRARTGFVLATGALKSPGVLDAANHPAIRFRATRITRTGPYAARIEGSFTIRGVTLPGQLGAELFRQPGTDPEDRDRLALRLTGSVDRTAFGARAYAGVVASRVDLDIVAFIRRAGP